MADELLKQLRQKLDETGDNHADIANHCGISPRAFSNFMHGRLKGGSSFKKVASLANYVGCELRLVKR